MAPKKTPSRGRTSTSKKTSSAGESGSGSTRTSPRRSSRSPSAASRAQSVTAPVASRSAAKTNAAKAKGTVIEDPIARAMRTTKAAAAAEEKEVSDPKPSTTKRGKSEAVESEVKPVAKGTGKGKGKKIEKSERASSTGRSKKGDKVEKVDEVKPAVKRSARITAASALATKPAKPAKPVKATPAKTKKEEEVKKVEDKSTTATKSASRKRKPAGSNAGDDEKVEDGEVGAKRAKRVKRVVKTTKTETAKKTSPLKSAIHQHSDDEPELHVSFIKSQLKNHVDTNTAQSDTILSSREILAHPTEAANTLANVIETTSSVSGLPVDVTTKGGRTPTKPIIEDEQENPFLVISRALHDLHNDPKFFSSEKEVREVTTTNKSKKTSTKKNDKNVRASTSNLLVKKPITVSDLVSWVREANAKGTTTSTTTKSKSKSKSKGKQTTNVDVSFDYDNIENLSSIILNFLAGGKRTTKKLSKVNKNEDSEALIYTSFSNALDALVDVDILVKVSSTGSPIKEAPKKKVSSSISQRKSPISTISSSAPVGYVFSDKILMEVESNTSKRKTKSKKKGTTTQPLTESGLGEETLLELESIILGAIQKSRDEALGVTSGSQENSPLKQRDDPTVFTDAMQSESESSPKKKAKKSTGTTATSTAAAAAAKSSSPSPSEKSSGSKKTSPTKRDTSNNDEEIRRTPSPSLSTSSSETSATASPTPLAGKKAGTSLAKSASIEGQSFPRSMRNFNGFKTPSPDNGSSSNKSASARQKRFRNPVMWTDPSPQSSPENQRNVKRGGDAVVLDDTVDSPKKNLFKTSLDGFVDTLMSTTTLLRKDQTIADEDESSKTVTPSRKRKRDSTHSSSNEENSIFIDTKRISPSTSTGGASSGSPTRSALSPVNQFERRKRRRVSWARLAPTRDGRFVRIEDLCNEDIKVPSFTEKICNIM